MRKGAKARQETRCLRRSTEAGRRSVSVMLSGRGEVKERQDAKRMRIDQNQGGDDEEGRAAYVQAGAFDVGGLHVVGWDRVVLERGDDGGSV